MEKVALGFGAIFMAVAAILLILPFATLCGGIAGVIVGAFFGDTITGTFAQIGIHASMWQIGATLGFVGGFLRTKVDAKKA